MSDSESDLYYREQAEDCRKMAARARSPQARSFWLKKSDDWLSLISRAERPAGLDATHGMSFDGSEAAH
jgi:hypothetical protein